MPLPTVELQWQYDCGRALGPAHTGTYDDFLFAFLSAFQGFPVNPWREVGSSDSVTAGMDGVKRITAATKLVWSAAGARSWLVLQNAAGLQLLFHCGHNDQEKLEMSISKDGFTGGSTTAAPTATDQIGFGYDDEAAPGNPMYWDVDLSGTANRLYMLHSTDGRHTRAFFTGTIGSIWEPLVPRNYRGAWIIGELVDAPLALTKPYYAFQDSMTTPTHTGMTWLAIGSPGIACFMPSGPTKATYLAENSVGADVVGVAAGGGIHGIGPIVGRANQISGNWPMQEFWLYEPVLKATMGRPADLWLGASGTGVEPVETGTVFPSTGAKRFAQFGPFVVPWGPGMAAPVVP